MIALLVASDFVTSPENPPQRVLLKTYGDPHLYKHPEVSAFMTDQRIVRYPTLQWQLERDWPPVFEIYQDYDIVDTFSPLEMKRDQIFEELDKRGALNSTFPRQDSAKGIMGKDFKY